ncbi:MAG: hypothetical protein L0220_12870 [Acidobacteria bacterium]|nr:hypothetical protein [Acidobacteriota bacterium]
MKKSWTKWFFLAIMVIAIFPVMGLAQGRINERQRNQHQRIHQGIRSGELTRREAHRLHSQQARIRAREYHLRRSGGEFTARERYRIQRQLNRSSRGIYRQKHDRQDRD